MERDIYLWLHLLGLAAYAGTSLAIAAICLPLARAESDPIRRLRVAAGAMRVYDPLSIAALGVLVMTGAFSLTAHKAALHTLFFARVGTMLAWKLAFTFLLVNLGAYIAFGIGHRLVRTADAEEAVDEQWLDSMLGRLRASLVASLVLTAIIVWIAIRMPLGALPQQLDKAPTSHPEPVEGSS